MKEYFSLLSRYLPGKRVLATIILIVLLLQSAVFLSFQVAYKEIFDGITQHVPLINVLFWIGVVFIASIIRIALLILGDYLGGKITVYIFNQIRTQLYNHLQWLSAGFYQRSHMTAFVSGYSHDLQQSEVATRQALPLVITSIATVLFALALLFYFDYRLASLVFILLPLLMLGSFFFVKPAKETTRRNQLANSRLFSLLDEVARQHLIDEHGDSLPIFYLCVEHRWGFFYRLYPPFRSCFCWRGNDPFAGATSRKNRAAS